MKRIPFPVKGLLALVLAAGFGAPAPAADRPNVLFIFADDMTYDAIHAVGIEELRTPNLDRLVAAGTTFSHAYNSGAWHGAVCVASRTMLLTGRQLWHAKAVDNRKKFQAECVAPGKTWPQLLEKAGYKTFMTGKWHVQADPVRMFNVTSHVRPGMPKSVKKAYNRPLEGQPDPWSASDRSLGGYWQGGTHWSVVQADDAVGFLRGTIADEQPFFIYLAFNAPHDPRQSPRKFLDMYPVDRIAVPKSFQPSYPYRDAMGCPHKLRDENLAPMPRTKHSVQVHRREYYALITHLDVQIGRVLDALKATGKAENTYIVFTADHGLAIGKHGLFGKQSMYDHSVRVPFVVVGPGVAKGATNHAPIYLQDVVPSTLDWAGAKIPDHIEFESIQPFLEGKGTKRPFIYGAYRNLQRAITADGYKLIYYPKAKKALLYHLAADPDELVDLLEEPTADARRRAQLLLLRLKEAQPSFGDELALPETL